MKARLVFAVVVAAGLTIAPLVAHMKMAKASPAPDSTATAAVKQIQLWFTQQPDAKVSRIELSGPSGTTVALAPLHAMPDKSVMVGVTAALANGAYTVRWQSAGDDGHVQKGEYTFTVNITR